MVFANFSFRLYTGITTDTGIEYFSLLKPRIFFELHIQKKTNHLRSKTMIGGINSLISLFKNSPHFQHSCFPVIAISSF